MIIAFRALHLKEATPPKVYCRIVILQACIIMASGDGEDAVVEDVFAQFLGLPEEVSTRRETCGRCRRPANVCICSCFPEPPLPIQTRIIVLQHPHEESRSLATVPLLQKCIPSDKITIVRGKRFGPDKSAVLSKALRSRKTVVLYPGKDAVDVCSLPRLPIGVDDDAAVIAIDGTWSQSKGLYSQNPRLHDATQVQLNVSGVSEYVIRTQPTKGSLSTLECLAHTLAWLENDDKIVEVLTKPLRALCQHQLDHGAVKHQSKDDPNYITRWEMKARLRDTTVLNKDADACTSSVVGNGSAAQSS